MRQIFPPPARPMGDLADCTCTRLGVDYTSSRWPAGRSCSPSTGKMLRILWPVLHDGSRDRNGSRVCQRLIVWANTR